MHRFGLTEINWVAHTAHMSSCAVCVCVRFYVLSSSYILYDRPIAHTACLNFHHYFNFACLKSTERRADREEVESGCVCEGERELILNLTIISSNFLSFHMGHIMAWPLSLFCLFVRASLKFFAYFIVKTKLMTEF